MATKTETPKTPAKDKDDGSISLIGSKTISLPGGTVVTNP